MRKMEKILPFGRQTLTSEKKLRMTSTTEKFLLVITSAYKFNHILSFFFSFIDEKAIAEAVAQVEREIEDEEFRENPSIWDIVGKPQAGNSPADYLEDKNMTVGMFRPSSCCIVTFDVVL
jgi:hypothetical protein